MSYAAKTERSGAKIVNTSNGATKRVIILWKILRLIVPELTRPFDSLADGPSEVFRFT